jgi:hypothetical protein
MYVGLQIVFEQTNKQIVSEGAFWVSKIIFGARRGAASDE